jgi:hypothetical protein
MKMFQSENWQANAINIRTARAVAEAGGRETLFAPIVAAGVKRFEEIGGSITDGAKTADALRSVGGWGALVKALIGDAPDGAANELGMYTAPAWYVWSFLQSNVYDIVNEIKRRLFETKAPATAPARLTGDGIRAAHNANFEAYHELIHAARVRGNAPLENALREALGRAADAYNAALTALVTLQSEGGK